LGALVALKFYYVREMVAALVIFSALFAIGTLIVLVVFTLDHIAQGGVAWAEPAAVRFGRWAATSSAAIAGQIALSSQRLRFSTVRINRPSRRS